MLQQSPIKLIVLVVAEDSVSVICRKQDADFILCNLSKKRFIYNVPLNLDFELGGEISFHVSGNGTVHLTGKQHSILRLMHLLPTSFCNTSLS